MRILSGPASLTWNVELIDPEKLVRQTGEAVGVGREVGGSLQVEACVRFLIDSTRPRRRGLGR